MCDEVIAPQAHTLDQGIPSTSGTAIAPYSGVPSDHVDMSRSRHGIWSDPRGQSTVEYVMIAGSLAALGLAISAILSDAVKTMVVQLAHAIRTVAP